MITEVWDIIVWHKLKRMMRYLAGMQKLGIVLKKSLDFNISAFCDADWASNTVDRRSHTRYMVYVGKSLVVPQSSTEFMFMAVASTTTEIEWVASLFITVWIGNWGQKTLWITKRRFGSDTTGYESSVSHQNQSCCTWFGWDSHLKQIVEDRYSKEGASAVGISESQRPISSVHTIEIEGDC